MGNSARRREARARQRAEASPRLPAPPSAEAGPWIHSKGCALRIHSTDFAGGSRAGELLDLARAPGFRHYRKLRDRQ